MSAVPVARSSVSPLPSTRNRVLAWIAVLIATHLALEGFAIATHRIPVSSDQAVAGLMAKHILEGKGHPVFYYGATYAGSLEPHFVAAVFAVFGPSVAAYRLAMGLLFAGMALGVFLFTRRFFGRSSALFALACFAISPYFLLYKGLTSDGAYDSVALLTLAMVALALWIDERAAEGPIGPWRFFALGAIAGTAFWVMPHTAAVSAVVALWLLSGPARRTRPLNLLFGLAGALVGASPWWIWNLRHRWASLRAPELGSVGWSRAAENFLEQIWVSLPTLEGGFVATPDYHTRRETFAGSRALSLVLIAALLAPAVVRAIRGDRRCRLLLAALICLFAAASFSARLLPTEPRYVFSYYVLAIPLLGLGFATLAAGRWRIAAVAVGLGLLGVHAASSLLARVSYRNVDLEVTGPVGDLISYLERNRLTRVYASYWTAYRLSFESRERVIATPIPGDELVRYEPALEEVNSSSSPALVLLDRRDRCMESFLRENRLPYQRSQVGSFGIYSHVPEQVLVPIRSGFGLPLPDEGHRVRWVEVPQTTRVPPGAARMVPVTFRNASPCRWRSSVHLGYHWTPFDAGRPPTFDSPRGFLPLGMLDPGETTTVALELRAPQVPGSYRLEYDLVQENVEWFSRRGGPTAAQRVEVR